MDEEFKKWWNSDSGESFWEAIRDAIINMYEPTDTVQGLWRAAYAAATERAAKICDDDGTANGKLLAAEIRRVT